MDKAIAVVIDCGATNVRAVAVDEKGEFIHTSSLLNGPIAQPGGEKGWLIWDLEEVWKKTCQTCREICAKIKPSLIRVVVVTTFGADGAPVDEEGRLTYPIISWQCSRTQPLLAEVGRRMDPASIYQLTGYPLISFNTLLRIIWLKENFPQVLERAHKWLMMPGLLNMKLTGELSMDPTIGSTMMAMDLKERDWSERMLALAGVDSSLFPPWVEPGQVIGEVTRKASQECGLPEGTPVVAGGHDTQFALLGSGLKEGEALLSSGTWEILMVRANKFIPPEKGYEDGLLIECDASPGLWNPQILMMGSGVLEWVRGNFFGMVQEKDNIYKLMISEGEKTPPGRLIFLPAFVPDTGPLKKYKSLGTILGLALNSSRGEVYRGALEGLSFQLKMALEVITRAANFQTQALRVVGGGAKNELWNQIRADFLELPVTISSQKEATVLGAALVGFVGSKVYNSIEEAQKQINFGEKTIYPSPFKDTYKRLYRRYQELCSFFRTSRSQG